MKKNTQKTWSEDLAIAMIQANTHGRKRKLESIIDLADAVSFLFNKYGDIKTVSKIVRTIQPEMVREFIVISRLPLKIKNLINNEKILIDAAWRLPLITNKKRQLETAKAIGGLTSHEQRAIIYYVANNEKIPVKQCRDKVLKSKNTKKEINMIMLPLDSNTFEMLQKAAKIRHSPMTNLARNILTAWVSRNSVKTKGV